MVGFSASNVEAMAYDFTHPEWWPDGPPEGFVLTGTIPEPTVEQITAYQDFWMGQVDGQREAVAELRRVQALPDDEKNAEQAEAALDSVRRIRAELAQDKLLPAQMEALADLCSQHPSAELLHALPFRVQKGFRDYVMGELVDAPKERSGSSA